MCAPGRSFSRSPPHAIAAATHGADHDIPNPSSTLLNQAALLLNTRANYSNAEPLYQLTLELNERVHGKDNPIVATCLNNLAQLLQDTNRLAEAEPLMRRAEGILAASFGVEHPNTVTCRNNLAILLDEIRNQ